MSLDARKPVFGGLRTTQAPAHLPSLISAFNIRILESIISKFISSNSRQYYIMLPSIPQNDADLITSRDEPPIRTQTCNPV